MANVKAGIGAALQSLGGSLQDYSQRQQREQYQTQERKLRGQEREEAAKRGEKRGSLRDIDAEKRANIEWRKRQEIQEGAQKPSATREQLNILMAGEAENATPDAKQRATMLKYLIEYRAKAGKDPDLDKAIKLITLSTKRDAERRSKEDQRLQREAQIARFGKEAVTIKDNFLKTHKGKRPSQKAIDNVNKALAKYGYRLDYPPRLGLAGKAVQYGAGRLATITGAEPPSQEPTLVEIPKTGALTENQINPQTGQEITLKNGKWVDVKTGASVK